MKQSGEFSSKVFGARGCITEGHDSTPQPCKACDAPVYWAENEATGKPAPIDAASNPDGNIYLFVLRSAGRRKLYRVLSKGQAQARRDAGSPLHTNHFQTCPFAKEFRR